MDRQRSVPYENLTHEIQAKELLTLLKVSSSLASTLELSEVLQVAIESATELIGLDTGAIYTLEDETLYLGATTPPLPLEFPDELRDAHLKDHPHIRNAVKSRAPVYLRDARSATLSAAERSIVDSRQLVSILYFPLILREETIGTFIVGTTSTVRQFTEHEYNLCNILAHQVSIAVANALLYKEAQQAIDDLTAAYDATLEGWSRVLDMRDHVTDEHTHRVADLAVALANKMGVPESDLVQIRRGALLHDIGKMGIPDVILQKPSVLSDRERAIMQKHPELAHQLISPISYLVPALDIPYCHHERWDGTGYPQKLKEEEIPLAARIFAVVDAYDALTSDRPYRKAWKKEDAVQYLREQSGKHFFPQAVTAFLELLKEQA